MKKALKDNLKYGFFCMALLLLFSCNSEQQDSAHTATKYTCPMHPQIVTDRPGACPICHMDLVPVHAHNSNDTADVRLENLVKPANQLVISQIRTVQPTEGVRTADTKIQGIINYDTNNWNSVSSRVSGRIERLYITYNYQYVTKGQKLMDIYSPDLANAQQELLYLKDNGTQALIEAAKTKLRVLGATDQQINKVLRTGKVDYTFSIYSPYSGYVAEQKTPTAADGGMPGSGTVISLEGGGSMNEMGGQSDPNPPQIPTVETNTPLQIREGQYISQGQKIFDLINASTVFAEFFAGTEQLTYLSRGTAVQVNALDNSAQQAFSKVSLMQPYYSEGTTFSLLRARLSNADGKWKVGQLITVKTDADSKFGTWLPRTAVLQLGSRYIAFVKKEQVFVPAYISVKERRGEWVDIGESLSKDTEVAVNGWFMVDSESFVRVDSL